MRRFHLAAAAAISTFLIPGVQGTGRASGQTTPASAPAAAATEQELRTWRIPNLAEAAECYFSPDGKSLIGNAKMPGDARHQVYTFSVDGTDIRRINDKGADACSFFFPDGKRLLWTSTRDRLDLPAGNFSDVKAYPQGAELYSSDLRGGELKRLTNNLYYDAEATVSPDGRWVLFGRQIDGKMELWRMRPDGTGEFQITNTPDWQEGGAVYMPDSETIIYRAWKVEDEGQRGTPMTVFTIKHDGTGTKPITDEPGMNWSPYPAPDGKHFAFVKMLPQGNFEIFMMNMETREQRRLTYHPGFDGFPAISPDGKLLAFASSRTGKPGERAIFMHLMDISSLNVGRK